MKETLLYVASTPFEAARLVEILPDEHKSKKLHGHSFNAKIRANLPSDWASFTGSESKDLQSIIKQSVDPIDYSFLNDLIAIPTDENIARWLWSQLNIPGLESIGIESTREQGVDLGFSNQAHIWHKFRFEAAHQLPYVEKGHPCGRMHGHGFEVILHANQDLDKEDMGVDYDLLEEIWKPIQEKLNYSCLNDIQGLKNPTSEVLANWIWEKIKPKLPVLSWVTVYETITAGCNYDGQVYRIWKEQRFESAVKLINAPDEDVRKRLHGHSYLVRLHLSAPLDDIMGWTVDYGDVKKLFKSLYNDLDHRLINEQLNIEDAGIKSILKWIQSGMMENLPQLDRIDLYETPNHGGILCWGNEGPSLPI
tara:strand:- start:398 stop:1492 length:1095 start_codon:yes stop_codon:yes gene_type:complete